jgi:hypothetical protein
MRYEGFSCQERQDEILDKISKYGVSSLSHDEQEFLDSYSNGKEEEIHNKLKYIENEKVFEDDNGIFRFEFEEFEDHGDEKHIIGTIYVPDLEFPNGSKLEGRIGGRIIDYGDGKTSPNFFITLNIKGKEVTYDIFEFCNGLEYELDTFIDYIVEEVENSNI